MKHRIAHAWRAHMHHPFRAALGAGIGIAFAAVISARVMGVGAETPFMIASLGASAVLAFAVPASPLAQPRAVIGGNVVSALAGVTAQRLAGGDPVLAMGLAVALAIFAMYLARCLHPPGGGLAMIAVMGGPHVWQAGYAFVLAPVLLNSLLLVAGAIAWSGLGGGRYPHRPEALPEPVPDRPVLPTRADIEAVLEAMDDLPDVSLDDLHAILNAAEAHAQGR